MNIRNSQRVWIKSMLVLFLLVASYGVVACDDSSDVPGCGGVPADLTDSFYQRNSVVYYCDVNGDQFNLPIYSDDGVTCNMLYTSGNLDGQGSGSITFVGEIDETGTLCDFTGTDPLLFVNSQTERGFVNSGEVFFTDPDSAKSLTISMDADFTIIGNFFWPPTECTCIGAN
jgi:hypothetical protein